MKKSSIFINTINFSKTRMKQLRQTIQHSLRLLLKKSNNIEEDKIHLNLINMINLSKLYENGTTEYVELDYKTNKLEFDLSTILDISDKTREDFKIMRQLLETGETLLNDIKSTSISKEKVETIKYLISKAKIEIETTTPKIETTPTEKPRKELTTKQQEKEIKKQYQEIQKRKEIEKINKLPQEERNQKLFELQQLDNIENMINNMIEKLYEDTNETPEQMVKNREKRKNYKKRFKKENINLDDFDSYYDEQIKDKNDDENSKKEIINNFLNEHLDSTVSTNSRNRRRFSLLKYVNEIKNLKRKLDNKVTGTTTVIQELIFKPVKDGITLSNEDLTKLSDQLKKEEEEKGNFVAISAIHNDESRPHIHLFIMSKTMNIVENQINFINKKYNKNFQNSKMTEEELIEYGQLTQKHYLEMVNNFNPNGQFVVRHLLDEKIEEFTDPKRKEIYINGNDRVRKIENKMTRKRCRKSINNRHYNNAELKLETIQETTETKNLKFSNQVQNETIKINNEKSELKQEKMNYRKELKQQYDKRLKERKIRQEEEIRKELTQENTFILQELKEEQTKETNVELKELQEQIKKLEEQVGILKDQQLERNNKIIEQETTIKTNNERIEKDKQDYIDWIKPFVENYVEYQQKLKIAFEELEFQKRQGSSFDLQKRLEEINKIHQENIKKDYRSKFTSPDLLISRMSKSFFNQTTSVLNPK